MQPFKEPNLMDRFPALPRHPFDHIWVGMLCGRETNFSWMPQAGFESTHTCQHWQMPYREILVSTFSVSRGSSLFTTQLVWVSVHCIFNYIWQYQQHKRTLENTFIVWPVVKVRSNETPHFGSLPLKSGGLKGMSTSLELDSSSTDHSDHCAVLPHSVLECHVYQHS